MKKILLISAGAVLVIIIAAVVFFYFVMQGPDIAQYEYLKNPQISQKADQKMIVVQAQGDPNVIGPKAFGLLFEIYYNTEGTEKGFSMPAPCARWPKSLDTPKEQWIGMYGLPVPDSITDLGSYEAVAGLNVSLETWNYGTVAEILHIGPYDKEEPTVNKLKTFIDEQGYSVSGVHEEEYLKGPGMFSAGDPEEYATIIRYAVAKIAESDSL